MCFKVFLGRSKEWDNNVVRYLSDDSKRSSKKDGGEVVKNQTIVTQIVASILAIIAITYGRLVNFPDAVHRLYGLPLNWGTHQLVSIAGPVDIWSVSVMNLVIDIVFWLAIIQISMILVERYTRVTSTT
jgi:hypothetical protein